MRAAVFHGREDLRLEDIPEPRTGHGEVKLKVLYNGICGSDLHEYYHGPMTTRTTPHPRGSPLGAARGCSRSSSAFVERNRGYGSKEMIIRRRGSSEDLDSPGRRVERTDS